MSRQKTHYAEMTMTHFLVVYRILILRSTNVCYFPLIYSCALQISCIPSKERPVSKLSCPKSSIDHGYRKTGCSSSHGSASFRKALEEVVVVFLELSYYSTENGSLEFYVVEVAGMLIKLATDTTSYCIAVLSTSLAQ
jgi:hypothetical protein